jgi:glutamyl-tRNA synthetase
MAVASLAVLVGSSESVRPIAKLDELGALVDLARLSRAPAKFDEAELDGLNAKTLHAMAYETAAPRLRAHGIDRGEAFWMAVRGNLERFADAVNWAKVIEGPIAHTAERDQAFLAQALAVLPSGVWDTETWGAWTAKGKELFMPLRLALTGLEHGPELKLMLPLIGETETRRRLSV